MVVDESAAEAPGGAVFVPGEDASKRQELLALSTRQDWRHAWNLTSRRTCHKLCCALQAVYHELYRGVLHDWHFTFVALPVFRLCRREIMRWDKVETPTSSMSSLFCISRHVRSILLTKPCTQGRRTVVMSSIGRSGSFSERKTGNMVSASISERWWM